MTDSVPALELRAALDLLELPPSRLASPVRAFLAGERGGFGWAPDGDRPAPATGERGAVAAALEATNAALGHPRASEAGALAAPDAVAVVAGQQPGLFGGPLLVLLKAVAAAGWAARLRAEGRPAVAIFWIASQDHDGAEVRSVGLPDGPLAPDEAPDEAPDLRPVGPRPLGPWPRRALEALARAAPSADPAFLARLHALHPPGATHTEAFAGTLLALLGAEAPLLLDPSHPALARLAAPALGRLLREAEALDAHLAAAAPDHHAPGDALLFRHDEAGARRRLRRVARGFEARGTGTRHSLAALLGELETAPARFTPTALGRPLVQEALLGPQIHVAGPGELAYWRPLAPLFATPPTLTLRPRAALVGADDAEALAAVGVRPEALLREGPEAFHRAAAGRAFEALRDDLEALLARHEARFADGPDPQAWARTRGSLRHNLRAFGARLRRARRRHEPDRMRAAQAALARVLPGGGLPDATLSGAWARLRFGADLVPALRRLDLDPRRLHVLGPATPEPTR